MPSTDLNLKPIEYAEMLVHSMQTHASSSVLSWEYSTIWKHVDVLLGVRRVRVVREHDARKVLKELERLHQRHGVHEHHQRRRLDGGVVMSGGAKRGVTHVGWHLPLVISFIPNVIFLLQLESFGR
jgi:hypothetical protein